MGKNGLNKIEFSGNLVKDAEFASLPSGAVVANFRIAVNRSYQKRDGSEAKETLFINVAAYPKKEQEATFEALLHKGAGVHVKGALSYRVKGEGSEKKEFYTVRAFEVAGIQKAGEKAA